MAVGAARGECGEALGGGSGRGATPGATPGTGHGRGSQPGDAAWPGEPARGRARPGGERGDGHGHGPDGECRDRRLCGGRGGSSRVPFVRVLVTWGGSAETGRAGPGGAKASLRGFVL